MSSEKPALSIFTLQNTPVCFLFWNIIYLFILNPVINEILLHYAEKLLVLSIKVNFLEKEQSIVLYISSQHGYNRMKLLFQRPEQKVPCLDSQPL